MSEPTKQVIFATANKIISNLHAQGVETVNINPNEVIALAIKNSKKAAEASKTAWDKMSESQKAFLVLKNKGDSFALFNIYNLDISPEPSGMGEVFAERAEDAIKVESDENIPRREIYLKVGKYIWGDEFGKLFKPSENLNIETQNDSAQLQKRILMSLLCFEVTRKVVESFEKKGKDIFKVSDKEIQQEVTKFLRANLGSSEKIE